MNWNLLTVILSVQHGFDMSEDRNTSYCIQTLAKVQAYQIREQADHPHHTNTFHLDSSICKCHSYSDWNTDKTGIDKTDSLNLRYIIYVYKFPPVK